jgi:CRISPR/Cas system-associated exonuclease Cas4 (RecB family)
MSKKKSNTTQWSYSRRETLEQCARAYYFTYYGANKKTAKDEPNKKTLHFLKQLQNRHQRAGDLLHLAISTYFRRARDGETWVHEPDRLIAWAKKMFRADRKYSRSHPKGNEQAKKQYGRSPTLLQEYYHQYEDADQLWQDAEAKMVNALQSFSTNESLSLIRANGCKPEALIEKAINLQIHNVKVVGRVDLAYPDDGKITVIDWKIGSASRDGRSSLQLAVYALWATHYFECDPEKIDVYMVHLESNDVTTTEITKDELASVRVRILQDAELLTNLQSYGKKAVEDAFPRLLHPPICSLCQYQEICYD